MIENFPRERIPTLAIMQGTRVRIEVISFTLKELQVVEEVPMGLASTSRLLVLVSMMQPWLSLMNIS